MNTQPTVQAPVAAPVESNVCDWISHQLTVEGPARAVPVYCADAHTVSHGFIESMSLDDHFEGVFGEVV